jgi:hypothetical protein
MGFKVSRTHIAEVTPVLDTNAYATGDHLGSIHTINSALSNTDATSILVSLIITDAANQKAALEVHLFSALPTLTSSDNAAIRIADSEVASYHLGYISVAATDYVTLDATAGNAVAVKTGLNIVVNNKALGTSIYAVVVSRGSPTYAASSLVFKYGFLQD